MILTERQRDCIRDLYQKMHLQLVRLASYYDQSQAEDLVDEAFCVACEKPRALMAAAIPEIWIMRTLRNVVRNQKSKDMRWNKILVPMEDWMERERVCYMIEEYLYLPEHVPRVTDEDLKSFYRAVLYGETAQDEAKRLHIGVWAWRKRYERTKKRIAKWFSEQNKEDLNMFQASCQKSGKTIQKIKKKEVF